MVSSNCNVDSKPPKQEKELQYCTIKPVIKKKIFSPNDLQSPAIQITGLVLYNYQPICVFFTYCTCGSHSNTVLHICGMYCTDLSLNFAQSNDTDHARITILNML